MIYPQLKVAIYPVLGQQFESIMSEYKKSQESLNFVFICNPSSNLKNNLTHSPILHWWHSQYTQQHFNVRYECIPIIAVSSAAHQIITNTNQNLPQWEMKLHHFCYRMVSLSSLYVDWSMQQMHSYKYVAVVIFPLKILQIHALHICFDAVL